MSIWAKTWAYEQHPKRVEDDKVTEKKHPAAKAVLVALAEYPGPGQRHCWPSQKTLANMTDYSERQVRACLSDLEKQKLIRRTERKRKDGTRRSDMIELLGSIECFGPPQDEDDQPEESSGCAEESSGGTRKRVPGMNRHKEPSVITPVGASSDATADEFVSFLAEALASADVPYTKGWRGRHGRQFKECIAKGVESKTLYKACDRVVERWTGEEHRKLTVDQALGDVINGKPPANVTPLRRPSERPADLGSNSEEAAARRTEGYEFFFA